MKDVWLAYAIMWIAVSVAVGIGLYFTRNIHCLWFLLIPSFVSVTDSAKDKKGKNRNGHTD